MFTPARSWAVVAVAGLLAAVWLGLLDPAVVLEPPAPGGLGVLAGTARVTDGDTIVINGTRVRLIGIDAPEAQQGCQRDGRSWRCGTAATEALRGLVGHGTVRCQDLGRDRYARALAVCWAGGTELNRELVRAGWAVAYYPRRGVTGPRYETEQAEARAAKRGLWSGSFVPPAQHRRGP